MSKTHRRRIARWRRRRETLTAAASVAFSEPLPRLQDLKVDPVSQKIGHLVYTPFTGMGSHSGFRGEEWFKHRLQIFKDYTLRSLLNQTSRSFVHWLSFRREEANNPRVAELAQYLAERKYPFIFTFDGLMYHDDKFSQGLWERLLNFGRVMRDCFRQKTFRLLKSGIKELWIDKNENLLERLAHSLKVLQNRLEPVDWIYLTRLDSDDMFRNDAIEYIQKQPPFFGAYIFKNGYIYNKNTEELCEYQPSLNPPFHTIVFKSEDFFKPEKHIAYYKNFKSHEDIPKVFNSVNLGNGYYCVLIHKKQVSTVWNHPFRGKAVVDNKEKILQSFGIK